MDKLNLVSKQAVSGVQTAQDEAVATRARQMAPYSFEGRELAHSHTLEDPNGTETTFWGGAVHVLALSGKAHLRGVSKDPCGSAPGLCREKEGLC